jgi:serine/threonine-protein kinase
MRSLAFFVVGSLAALALEGCAGSSSTQSLPGTTAQSLPANALQSPVRSAWASAGPETKLPKNLFVSDLSANVVDELAGGSYHEIESIKTGLNEPDGVWIDAKGNLYVANVGAPNVTEYAPGATTPTCTYTSSDLVSPIAVVTDSKQNVYVIDTEALNPPGYVHVYAQCSTETESLNIGGLGWGLALDANDDLFVDYDTTFGTTLFEEFVAGSSSPTQLGVTVPSALSGLAIDGNGTLIAAGQENGELYSIASPYTTATVVATGEKDPFAIALSQNQKLLFVTNPSGHSVNVYHYPAMKLTRKLVTPGIIAPQGVAYSPNFTE